MGNAEEFNRIRRIIYSTFHKDGPLKSYEYLEGYKKKLGPPSYIGLKAELGFYHKYAKELKLTIAADAGDHTDFTGTFSRGSFRIDVTTNAKFKKLNEYEPLQKAIDAKYKIAIVKPDGDIEEILDINFPFCPECEEGRLIETAILLPENYSEKGDCLWTNDQVLIGVCNNCEYYEEYNRLTTHFLNNYRTELHNAYEAIVGHYDFDEILKEIKFDERKIIEKHTNSILPYLQKEFNSPIMSIGDSSYEITSPKDGDGFNCIKILWKKDIEIIKEYINDNYEIDLT